MAIDINNRRDVNLQGLFTTFVQTNMSASRRTTKTTTTATNAIFLSFPRSLLF